MPVLSYTISTALQPNFSLIFEELEEAAEDGKQVQIDWCYRADDSSMQEAGEDFEEDFENAQYQLVEI